MNEKFSKWMKMAGGVIGLAIVSAVILDAYLKTGKPSNTSFQTSIGKIKL